MKVRALRDIFMDATFRKKGEVFHTETKSRHVEILDASSSQSMPQKRAGARKAAMNELRAMGVKFPANISTEELEQMIREAKKKFAPASTQVPSKETALPAADEGGESNLDENEGKDLNASNTDVI